MSVPRGARGALPLLNAFFMSPWSRVPTGLVLTFLWGRLWVGG
ncbi:hypothetical protein C4J93_2711 [Pseudomonas sp. R2-37-08W]|nr:hypothetical protein C4J93_2711 [Pseudomonas sp. R2-37-08W]AZF42649.1 hypothetical protein C4J87_2490 [Pseudomonas sp. R1-43-08]